MELRVAIPLLIFALTYVVIAIGRLPLLSLDRTGAALVGAVAMVICGVLGERDAERAIDFPTLTLLLGMMIVVANLRLSSAFVLAARSLLGGARSGQGLLAMTVIASGVLAAFFINDVVCLALTPLLIEAAAEMSVEPVPILLALATASNIGSMATVTGNPQNMIVAGYAHLQYAAFAEHLGPVAIAGLLIDYCVIGFVYRRELGRAAGVEDLGPYRYRRALRPLIIKSVTVTLGVLLCFTLGFPTHLVALAAASILLVTRRVKPTRVYELVDWTMLLMFAGLFVVVAGVETTGFQNELIKAVGVDRLANPLTLGAVSAGLSNLVSNVPAMLLFRPVYPMLGNSTKAGLILASTSTLAGNLTVVGSIANLIVIEEARHHGIRISFGEYLRVGLPVAIATLALDIVFLQLM